MPNQPSGVHTTQELAEKALERIGAYSVNATGADPVELQRTLEWMDLVVSELAETEQCWWLVPTTISQTLTANDGTYTLSQFANYPAQGIAHIVSAYINDGTSDTRISILRRDEYEEISIKTTAGEPEGVYIDRLQNDKNVFLYPVQSNSTTILKIVAQQFAPDVRGGEGNLVGNVDHGFPRAWQLWLIKATAYEISGGPVRKLSKADRSEIATERDDSFDALMAFHNRERPSQPRRTRAWGRV